MPFAFTLTIFLKNRAALLLRSLKLFLYIKRQVFKLRNRIYRFNFFSGMKFIFYQPHSSNAFKKKLESLISETIWDDVKVTHQTLLFDIPDIDYIRNLFLGYMKVFTKCDKDTISLWNQWKLWFHQIFATRKVWCFKGMLIFFLLTL